jgi:hypothetical protein
MSASQYRVMSSRTINSMMFPRIYRKELARLAAHVARPRA